MDPKRQNRAWNSETSIDVNAQNFEDCAKGERATLAASGIAKLAQVLAMVLAVIGGLANAVAAEGDGTVQFYIEAQDLGSALNEFAQQSDQEILFVEEEIADKATSGIFGRHLPIVALERLLADADLHYRVNDLNTILVGSHIRVLAGEKAKPRNLFQRLATGVATALGGTRASNDEARSTTSDESGITEEIVVFGIRGSMRRSLERKRSADHFVDAITAEDIGAFPSQNLAEAMQRIPGVAIDRKSGEGAFVSVRGLGPQFVQTTIHGRVAASNVSPGSHDGLGNNNRGSRAVGFNNFQGGLVQAVEVHKSPRADHVEGGLGGFIDIQPRRPLDLGRRLAALTVDATVNELADDTAPGVFAMFSDVLTDNLGFMVSAQWDNRVFRSDFMSGTFLGDPRTITLPSGETLTGYYPNQVNAEMHITDRDRLNLSSSLQWQPSGRVDVTFDLLYADISTDEVRYLQSFRLSQGSSNITGGTVVDDNGTSIFTTLSNSGTGAFIEHATEQVENEFVNFGVNIRIQATDQLSFNIDAAISETDSPLTNRDVLMKNQSTQLTYTKDGPGGLPMITSTSPWNDAAWWVNQKHSIQSHLVDDRQTQIRVDATYEFSGDWLDTFQGGVRAYRQDRADTSRYLNSGAFRKQSHADLGGILPWPESDFMGGLGMSLPTNIPLPNFDALQETFVTRPDDVLNGKGFNTGTEKSLAGYTQQGLFNEDLNHEDDGNAIYAMVTFSGELGNTPYSGNIGLRYIDNSNSTIGEMSEPLDIDFSDPSAPEVIVGPAEFVSVAHDYTEMLPSLNLRFDPTDDIVVRASVAKVMSRPNYLDLNPRFTVQARNLTGRAGNGELDPTTAVQFDLAVEWYFAGYSIVSVGLFTKDIDALVQPDLDLVPFSSGVLDPETNLPVVLATARPFNSGNSELTGIELSFQRTFEDLLPAPFDGLGVIANYTFIDSGSDFLNEKTGASYGIPGLSENTLDLTVFYEKDQWRARLSYNFRDEFLDGVLGGFSGHPRFVESYEQWDASFGYSLNENMSFAFEAINLADENVYYYNLLATGTQQYRSQAINTGRRYQFGFRWKM